MTSFKFMLQHAPYLCLQNFLNGSFIDIYIYIYIGSGKLNDYNAVISGSRFRHTYIFIKIRSTKFISPSNICMW